jgi:hypothetical protein
VPMTAVRDLGGLRLASLGGWCFSRARKLAG